MIDAWIAYCNRSKADDKVLSDCLSALRDESTRVSVSCQTAFDEEVAEEAAESGKTAGAEGAAERSARMRAALGANVGRCPVVLAALRRVAQAKAASEAAKDKS